MDVPTAEESELNRHPPFCSMQTLNRLDWMKTGQIGEVGSPLPGVPI